MENIVKSALKLAGNKYAFVGSLSENNMPNIKSMLVTKRVGIKTYYFVSNNSAMRTKQFKDNNNACLYFIGKIFQRELMLEGTMEILDDIENKKLIWKGEFEKKYRNGGINDPDLCILKFTAINVRYYNNKITEIIEIK